MPPQAAPVEKFSDGIGYDNEHQIQWLLRANRWIINGSRFGTNWEGVQVLGGGSFGIAGHWKYRGSANAHITRDLVVKQSAGEGKEALLAESRLLRLCMRCNSEHIVKLYKAYFQAGGTGTLKDGVLHHLPDSNSYNPIDPFPFVRGGDGFDRRVKYTYKPEKEVGRIFLEYCGNGDLYATQKGIMKTNRRDGRWVAEEGKLLSTLIWYSSLWIAERHNDFPGLRS